MNGASKTNPNGAVRLIVIRIPETKKVIDIKVLINHFTNIASANSLASGLPGYSELGNIQAITNKDFTPISRNRRA